MTWCYKEDNIRLTFGVKIQVFILNHQVPRSNKFSHYLISLYSESNELDTEVRNTNFRSLSDENGDAGEDQNAAVGISLNSKL